MPATSKSQQRLFGMVHAYQKGKLKNAPESIKRIAGSISKTDAKHFAQTKHDGLPERKEEKAAEFVKRAWRAAESFREENGPYGCFGPGGVAERYSVNIGSDGAVSSNLESKSTLVERQEKKAMALTPYERGFLSKCAEYNVSEDAAMELCKMAEGTWWDSAKAIGNDFWNNNKDYLKNLGKSMLIGGGLNLIASRFMNPENRPSMLGAFVRGGLYGNLAYNGYRGMRYIDNKYNNGQIGNWLHTQAPNFFAPPAPASNSTM